MKLEFDTMTGTIVLDLKACKTCESKACVKACEQDIFKMENEIPSIEGKSIAKKKCVECLACEQECFLLGNKGLATCFPIPGYEIEVNN